MKSFALIFIIVGLVACKKNNSVQQSLPAQVEMDVSYGDDAAQKMDIYLPAGRSTDTTRLMVLVHGGGWNAGDKSEFTPYLVSLRLKFPNYAIANINYRLATIASNHFPTQEIDMKSAVDYLVRNSGSYHISQKIVLVGASAGAHMALLQAYKYSSPEIKAVVDFFGPTDVADLHNFYASGSERQTAIEILMNGSPNSNSVLYEQSSPVNYVTLQSPPTIIFHGTMDNVVPIAESVALNSRLSNAGVVSELVRFPNAGHEVWSLEIMNEAFTKTESFLKENVK